MRVFHVFQDIVYIYIEVVSSDIYFHNNSDLLSTIADLLNLLLMYETTVWKICDSVKDGTNI